MAPDRRFDTPREFTTTFHRAERSLTGVSHGLEWFYEPRARLPRGDLNALVTRGDTQAAALVRRRESEGFASLGDAGIRVTHQGRREDDAGLR